ncbi:hypothetical protein DEU56DRAFT_726231 [Suillus clintonianus]|uniref:uncharacterized protein n=1 Tax=Suillus clintonianus TaxID=1904413 RepID=UPI001B878964|nr:uncharacterized protein DEU56DRAFT_726231 [Suillus clintonianus]KAG2153879.1 hypothetical protein DEU56DRAFT_726231 [Suillus clintonianus]
MATKNVVVFGERGVGKSSIVNLLAGHKVAKTSPDTDVCTLHYEAYDVTIENVPHRIYDTAAADSDRVDPSGFLEAITNAHKLMKELSGKGGVHLLLYCIKAGRMPVMFVSNYRLFYEVLFEEKIPVAVVITHLEGEIRMDEWYTRNKGWFERHAVKCIDHACITAADDPEYREKYDMSRTEVGDLIRRHANTVENWNGGDAWLGRFTGKLKGLLTGRPSKCYSKSCSRRVRSLQMLYIFKIVISENRHKVIVLFGEMGAGKSSLVNLMAGEELASVSPDMKRCTMRWQEYNVSFGDKSYKVFDTIGIEEPQLGMKEYLESVENAYRLIKELDHQGGIDLLLFCIRAGNVSAALQSNYRLFHEFLCEKKVPIVLAITNLEREQRMEHWWERNKGTFDNYQIQVAGHACVTAANRLDDRHKDLYEESRVTIRILVEKFTADGQKQAWRGGDDLFVSLTSKLKKLLSGSLHVRRKDLAPHLTKRCGVSPDVAKQLADMIKQDVEAD